MLDLQTQTDEKAVIGRLHQQVFCNFKCSGKFIQFLFPGDLSAEEGHNEPSKDKKARTKSQQSGGSALQGKQTVSKKLRGKKEIFLLEGATILSSRVAGCEVTPRRE